LFTLDWPKQRKEGCILYQHLLQNLFGFLKMLKNKGFSAVNGKLDFFVKVNYF